MTRTSAAQRRAAAGSTCVYCGEARLTGDQRPEHPIPVVLDSAITVYTVCDECNTRAGSEVDHPWLNHLFVRAERAKWRIPDPRHSGELPRDPILSGVFTDEEGHRVVLEDGVPRYPGSIVRGEDSLTIAADTHERAHDLRERLERQLESEGHAVKDYSVETRSHRPWLTKRATISFTSGVRMGAKLGLAFGGEVFDEEWRSSDEARRLREWLWSDKPTNASGEVLAWVPSSSTDHPFADPPNHAAFFTPLKESTAVVVLVFGTLGFTVPVAPPGLRRPQAAWRAGPRHGSSVTTTFDELVLEAMRRLT